MRPQLTCLGSYDRELFLDAERISVVLLAISDNAPNSHVARTVLRANIPARIGQLPPGRDVAGRPDFRNGAISTHFPEAEFGLLHRA